VLKQNTRVLTSPAFQSRREKKSPSCTTALAAPSPPAELLC